MNRVIFLDVDGVLNSATWAEREREAGTLRGGEYFIDPEAVARLNALLKRSSAKIVMSSVWRYGKVRPTRELCRRIGVSPFSRLIGVTPYLRGRPRGEEIQAWLDQHPEVQQFCILDDDTDMGHLLPYLVRTNNVYGLTDSDVEYALALLNHQTPRAA